MLVTFAGMVNVPDRLVPVNAESPMLVTLEGMVSVPVRFAAFSNALLSMETTPYFMPMYVAVAGMVRFVPL